MYTWEELYRLMTIVVPATPLAKRYNVAPTQMCPVIRMRDEQTAEGALLRWGFIPSWSKDAKMAAALINARAETVAQKPSFRDAFRKRRCLVPISGFYEWQAVPGQKTKQPYYISGAKDAVLFLAGLWERWKSPEGAVETYTIVTTEANAFMRDIHDRMPVILSALDAPRWLDATLPEPELVALLKPAADDVLVRRAVSTLVNSPKNDTEECLRAAVGD